MKLIVSVAIAAVAAFGQTRVDLGNQSKNADFSAFPYTRPMKVVTALPATCTVGDMVFLTGSAPAINGCTATNTWTALAGAASAPGTPRWSTLTAGQWAALTALQWAALTQ